MKRGELEIQLENLFKDVEEFGYSDTHLSNAMALIDDLNIEKPKPKGKPLEQRKDIFYTKLITRVGKFGKIAVREFYDFWSEHGENDKKMRFEKQPSFDINKRLARWTKGNPDQSETFKPNTELSNK